jgi:hypothetical protein
VFRKERASSIRQATRERETYVSPFILPIINAKKSDLFQIDRRVGKRATEENASFFRLSPRVISGMRKNAPSHIARMLLNIGDKAQLSLSIVVFGFINIRYAFVCFVC